MSVSGPTPRSWLARGAALVLAPLAVWAAGSATSPSPPDDASIVAAVDALGERAIALTLSFLENAFPDAIEALPDDLRDRIDGLGVWSDGSAGWLEWFGTPPIPPPELLAAPGPAWTVRRTGAVTRLVVVAGPDAFGRRATAALRLATAGTDERIEALLPAFRGRPVRVEVETGAAASDGGAVVALPGGREVQFLAGTTGTGSRAAPVAAVSFVALLAILFPWGRWTQTGTGAGAAVVAVAAGRALLLATGAPAPPLPAGVGDARWYGTDAWLGLASSPWDLLATAAAAWLAMRAVTHALVHGPPARRPTRFAVAVLLAGGATAALVAVAHSCAVDARVRLMELDTDVLSVPGIAVGIGLAWFLVAAAEPWGLAWALRPGAGRGGGTPPSRAAGWIAVVPLALLAGLALHHGRDRVALDRLETEFAPQVLERGARRALALDTTVSWAAERAALAFPEAAADGPDAMRNLAFDLWSSSPLAHAGLRSSLTLHDARGVPLAHFGFDIPVLDELPGRGPAVREEPLELFSTVRQRLLHREQALVVDGERVGTIVGHVLDEPDNLGFLPVSRVYLACLGAAAAPEDGSAPFSWDAPEYVEYSPVGVARFHTLAQPPGWSYALDKAAIEGRTVRLSTGGVPYFARPLVENDRLHLLLAPAPTWLDRLGSSARVALVAIALIVLLDGLPRIVRRRGLAAAIDDLRGSYPRKLVVALLVASVVPWVGLSFGLQRNLERSGDSAREAAATQPAVVAQRVIEDYLDSLSQDRPVALPDDTLLYWLRRLVGQDIHLYEDGVLVATSKRELFDAGLAVGHLPAEVDFEINQSNRPVLVRHERVGAVSLPVAYAPVRVPGSATSVVVAVPLVIHQPEIARAVDRNVEMMLLSTLLVAGLLAAIGAPMARAVARPVRDLARAAGRVAAGEEDVRVEARGEDEMAVLGHSFNSMVASLARQRRDLERSRDHVAALLRHATTGVVSTDADGRVVTVNPAAARLLRRFGAAPAAGEALADAVGRIETLSPLADRLRAEPDEDRPEEIDLTSVDGEVRRIRMVRIGLPDPGGRAPGRLVLFDDVTDLMRRNQLEAWAEMARAIAHEIKNPLTPIQLSAEHLERVLADRGVLPSTEIEACLGTVRKQVRTLREIAAEFSAYARVPDLVLEPTDVAAFLEDVLAPYRTAPPAGVRIVLRHEAGPEVPIDRRALSRAVVNLVENGLHAMPDGGTLTVTSGPAGGGGTRVSIADSGVGLSDDVRARLFEPYFSTKSSGTGLGLAIVRRTVEGHGGAIEIESAPGRGTTFHVVLPGRGTTRSGDA